MEESYGEGLANHTGPESCGYGGDGVSEALTGERAGRVLSPESSGNIVEADAFLVCGRPHHLGRHRKTQKNPPGSETFSMYGSSLRETLLRRTDEKLGKLKAAPEGRGQAWTNDTFERLRGGAVDGQYETRNGS